MNIVHRVILAVLALIPFAGALRAAPRLNGPVRYDFVNNHTQVTLSAALIDDSSKENATGTLQLQLWATSAPYETGTIHGSLLATAKLEGLAAGQVYKDLHRTVAYTPPPARGDYFITMLLLEYRNGTYVIAQHANFKAKASLTPPPLFSMEGPWHFQTSNEGGTVEMNVAKITHRRKSNTGSLKLCVWLTDAPYTGGPLRGHNIGEVKKDPIKPGFAYTDVKNVAKYVRPPAGDYYPTLVLMEFEGDEYKVVAHLNANAPFHVAAP